VLNTSPARCAEPTVESVRGPRAVDQDVVDSLPTGPVWSDADVAGISVVDAPFVTVGGGLASFTLVDLLRSNGVPARDIRVVSPDRSPVDAFRRLAQASQITDHDRLRSDSSARLDNIWGFPGYALEESLTRRTLRPLWKVFAEPVAAEYFTPLSSHVYTGAAREAARIGWAEMAITGHAQVVRPRREGGFFTLVISDNACCSVIRSRYVHLGLGYPALRLVADLARYRALQGDSFSAVSAYEEHEHVYRLLAEAGGTVLVRGAGITAARVIERLLDVRDASGVDIRILHLVRRTPGASSPRPRGRHAAEAFDYQTFNFPKAAAGGQLARRIADLDEADRPAVLADLGGSTSPRRRGWQRQIRRASAAGAYRLLVGTVTEIDGLPELGLRISITDARQPAIGLTAEADAMIDCTGLHGEAADHPLLADLFRHDLAQRNAIGRLAVDENFEVREARNGPGRVHATGAMALGSRIAPVDSFWGLTQAALCVCDDLAAQGFCARIGVRRSMSGWWKWITGRRP
jgi:hypothetical protein